MFASKWKLPFSSRRQMACYGALQEAATFLAYKVQKDLAIVEGDQVLEAIFALVSRDEAAHAVDAGALRVRFNQIDPRTRWERSLP